MVKDYIESRCGYCAGCMDHQVTTTSAGRQVFAAGLMATLFNLVQQVVHQLRGNVALPEMFGPIQDVLLQVL